MTKKKRQRKEQRTQAHTHALSHEQHLPTLDEALDDLAFDPDLIDDLDIPPDPRSMERQLARLNRMLGSDPSLVDQHRILGPLGDSLLFSAGQMMNLDHAPPPSTPLERAQELIYDAFDTEDSNRRVRLAKKALSISPDCADAYVVLAEETDDRERAREYYEKGVEVGKRALGEAMFAEEAGNFWSIFETRPYMRALQGKATMHLVFGEQDEALDVYRGMLELNPVDNLGVRYGLAGTLLKLRYDDDLDELLKRYEEEQSAFWVYTTALHRYRRDGDTRRSRTALRDASDANPYVLVYLLGRRTVLAQALSGNVGLDEESEAATYFMTAVHEWLKTPGAVEWVREHTSDDLLDELQLDEVLSVEPLLDVP